MSSELSAACEGVIQNPSEENIVRLLDCWSPEWKHRGRQQDIGSGSYEIHCTLGLYAFGGNAPSMSKPSDAKEHALRSITSCAIAFRMENGFLAVIEPSIELHRDMGCDHAELRDRADDTREVECGRR